MTYILSQEADEYAPKNTHDKAKVSRTREGEGGGDGEPRGGVGRHPLGTRKTSTAGED